MNFLLHCRGDQRIYPIPNGLYELMADITREVLRCQPQDMYSFIYYYLDAQIKTRELAEEAVKILNKIIIDGTPMLKYLNERGITLEQAHIAASKIQNYWRGIKKRAATKTKTRRSTEEYDVSRESKLTPLQADVFATKIQAAFRGYLTRKKLVETLPKQDSYDSWDHDWLWKQFKDEGYENITTEQKIQSQKQFLKFLPLRRIPINKIDLVRIVHGYPEDYEGKGYDDEEQFEEVAEEQTLYEIQDEESSTETDYEEIADKMEGFEEEEMLEQRTIVTEDVSSKGGSIRAASEEETLIGGEYEEETVIGGENEEENVIGGENEGETVIGGENEGKAVTGGESEVEKESAIADDAGGDEDVEGVTTEDVTVDDETSSAGV